MPALFRIRRLTIFSPRSRNFLDIDEPRPYIKRHGVVLGELLFAAARPAARRPSTKGNPHEEKRKERRKDSEKREVGTFQKDWFGPGASLR
jgi:hypothetical protein